MMLNIFYVLIFHLYLPFSEMSVSVICPYSNWKFVAVFTVEF